MIIIVDAMGGDNAPEAQVKGALAAKKEFGCELLFVGERTAIERILREEGEDPASYAIEHTDVVLHTDEDPFLVVKGKRDSSMGRALELLKEGKGDALASSGNTGALLTGAQLITKRIRGVRRAALASVIPTKKGGALLLDCGATADCSAEYLEQFALMGSLYASRVMKKEDPRVGLLNNGAEETKGDELRREAYARLKKAGEEGRLRFAGNCEARDVTEGDFDVIVADGFSGNILMKDMFYRNAGTKIMGLMMKKEIGKLRASLDYKEIGGAPLIGVDHAVIKAHGSANAYAFRSAVHQAMEYVDSGFIGTLREEIAAGKEEKA